MRNIILLVILIVAFLIGVVSVIVYYSQDFTFELKLKDSIPSDEIYVVLQPQSNPFVGPLGGTFNLNNSQSDNIQSVSMIWGEMEFKNEGFMSRIIEIPNLIACFKFNAPNINNDIVPYQNLYWPVYSLTKPDLENSGKIVRPHEINPKLRDIYPQRSYYSTDKIEISSGEILNYYIYIQEYQTFVWGNSSSVFKGGTLEIYKMPDKKETNPLGEGNTFDKINQLYYNPSCDSLEMEIDPIKKIGVV